MKGLTSSYNCCAPSKCCTAQIALKSLQCTAFYKMHYKPPHWNINYAIQALYCTSNSVTKALQAANTLHCNALNRSALYVYCTLHNKCIFLHLTLNQNALWGSSFLGIALLTALWTGWELRGFLSFGWIKTLPVNNRGERGGVSGLVVIWCSMDIVHVGEFDDDDDVDDDDDEWWWCYHHQAGSCGPYGIAGSCTESRWGGPGTSRTWSWWWGWSW